VTVLTSLDGYALPPGFATPFHTSFVVAQLANLVSEVGAHGIVCSAGEVPFVRHFTGKEIYAVTPGIRAAGGATHDQARVTTIAQAVEAGSSLLVLGRAVTGAADPAAALEQARAERDAALFRAPAMAAQP
jgi:orotidine-5'-phosphate decarboxylase